MDKFLKLLFFFLLLMFLDLLLFACRVLCPNCPIRQLVAKSCSWHFTCVLFLSCWSLQSFSWTGHVNCIKYIYDILYMLVTWFYIAYWPYTHHCRFVWSTFILLIRNLCVHTHTYLYMYANERTRTRHDSRSTLEHLPILLTCCK